MKTIRETHTKETFFQMYLNKGFIEDENVVEIIFKSGDKYVSSAKGFFVKVSQYVDRVFINENCLSIEDIDYFVVERETLVFEDLKIGDIFSFLESEDNIRYFYLDDYNEREDSYTFYNFETKEVDFLAYNKKFTTPVKRHKIKFED